MLWLHLRYLAPRSWNFLLPLATFFLLRRGRRIYPGACIHGLEMDAVRGMMHSACSTAIFVICQARDAIVAMVVDATQSAIFPLSAPTQIVLSCVVSITMVIPTADISADTDYYGVCGECISCHSFRCLTNCGCYSCIFFTETDRYGGDASQEEKKERGKKEHKQ